MADLSDDLKALALEGAAFRAAVSLRDAFPSVKFTSGRRTRHDQARAMAARIVVDFQHVGHTYKPNDVTRAVQSWVNAQRGIRTEAGFVAGLLRLFGRFDDGAMMQLSRHFSGRAFDIQPVPGADGTRLVTFARRLPGLRSICGPVGDVLLAKPDAADRFNRWHLEFE
jgi:hypothetical protein